MNKKQNKWLKHTTQTEKMAKKTKIKIKHKK